MTIRLTWKRVAAAVVALAAAGMLFAWSGVFNVAASSGHWAPVSWFLHFTMRSSVRTHAALDGAEVKRAEPGSVSAAVHFARNCAACHGAPGVRPSPVMQAATPHAPDLRASAGRWSDRQLFWILEHGIKYTGMPAWPARERADEINRMVAFVRSMATLTPAQYRTLIEAADDRGPGGGAGVSADILSGCVACHGSDGRGRGQADIPVLGGQRPEYLAQALADYAAGRRKSAVMQSAVTLLTPADVTALARHFAAMPGLGEGAAGRRDAAAERIVTAGLREQQLPACASCHTAGKRYPVLAGQHPAYLAARLRQWRGDEKVVDARKDQSTMPVIARRIPEEMIDRVALEMSRRPHGR